jgi:hypothetical protein
MLVGESTLIESKLTLIQPELGADEVTNSVIANAKFGVDAATCGFPSQRKSRLPT